MSEPTQGQPGECDIGQALAALESAIGHCFLDRDLLAVALRHASFANEAGDLASNERLEFLGDSVIGMVVAHLLYQAHGDWDEGDLTRGLHRLVDRRALAALGRRLDLGALLQLGRTELQSGGEQKESILADATEAIIGAMYLDGGVAPVMAFARNVFRDALAADAPRVERDAKTALQERVMADGGSLPRYEVVEDSQVEGDEERFAVLVRVAGEMAGRATGRSKRVAEKRAARAALDSLADGVDRG